MRARVFGLLAVVVLLAGCGLAPVTTSTGATVPAGVVIAQDATADVLSELKDVYLHAVAEHDGLAEQEAPERHAARRARLVKARLGLQAAGNALETWKASSSGAPPREVLRPAADAIPDLLEIAAEFGLLPKDRADAILRFIRPLLSAAGERGLR